MELMTIDEIADFLRISKVTVYRFLDKNKKYYDSEFPQPVRIGRSVAWIKSEIEAWVSSKAKRGTDKDHAVIRNLKSSLTKHHSTKE